MTETEHDQARLREISLEWERQTGYDSIQTIERMYERREGGTYMCIWPGCTFTRHDAVVLWKHVHTAHGTACPPAEALR